MEMFRLVFIAFTLLSVAQTSSGIKWVKMTAGDPLPKDSIAFPTTSLYVGRARHFDDILPAKVWLNSSATINRCGRLITKHIFEVLTSARPCTWQILKPDQSLPEDLLLVGHEKRSSPIFVGWYYSYSEQGMNTFSLTSNELDYLTRNEVAVLVCPSERVWIDVSAKDVPKNAVSAGKSRDGHEMFVARLQKDCQIYPGQVVPTEGIATTWVGEEVIEGRYCQVLTDDSDKYSWVSITDDEFPDNAVVASSDGSNLYYIVKELTNDIVIYVTNLFLDNMDRYKILVENVKEVEKISDGDSQEDNYREYTFEGNYLK